MFDLNALPAHYLSTYGAAKIAEVTGNTKSIVAMWQKTNRFPLDAVSKLLDFDPSPLAAVTPLYTNPKLGNKLAILVPLMGPPEPKMMDSLIRLYDPKEMAYQRFAFNCLSVSRNALAAWFLRGPYEWAFWMDGDSLLPCGDAEWFKEQADLPQMADVFAGVHSIFRMLYHKKSIVSCCYVERRSSANPQFGGELSSKRQMVARGPQNKLVEAPWVGFGGVLTHRTVFEDIIKTQGDEIRLKKDSALGKRFGYEYAFFHPQDTETPGDDIPWCSRAARAGHRCFVDLAVQAAHIGDRAYTYADIK